jgi:hypothetical protein
MLGDVAAVAVFLCSICLLLAESAKRHELVKNKWENPSPGSSAMHQSTEAPGIFFLLHNYYLPALKQALVR